MSAQCGDRCSQCEMTTRAVPLTGTLYLLPPVAHVQASLEGALRQVSAPASMPFPGVLATPLEAGTLQRLGAIFIEMLSPVELHETRALVVPECQAPEISSFMRARSLQSLLAAADGSWLQDLLHDDRLLMHFQPIVRALDPARVFAHECLLRGVDRDGALIPPGRIFAAAMDADLLYYLDRAARVRAIRDAYRYGLDTHIFINFCPSSIYNPASCLRTTIGAVYELGIDPGRVVFEVVESDTVRDAGHLVAILNSYRAAGFGIALDDFGAGFSSLNLLERLRPDFVKLDRGLISNVDANPFKATLAQKLLEAAHELGITTIAEGIERADEWAWVRDHGADYAQGFLFARPAVPPPPVATARLAMPR